MSRIGKTWIRLPQGVEVTLQGRDVRVKGPKGELSGQIPPEVNAVYEDDVIKMTPVKEHKRYSPIWGTARANVANMVKGVSEGFHIPLKLQGVGYRAQMQGNKLVLSLGYSHPVEMEIPAGITATVNENTEVVISGMEKQAVGEFAANVRKKRPPEPFKGKGVRYANEYISMKEGKKK